MNLGIFTLSISVLWGLFIVAKIHAYKFKNFSHNIKKITTILLFFLISLTILGYSIIIISAPNSSTITNYSSFDIEEVNY